MTLNCSASVYTLPSVTPRYIHQARSFQTQKSVTYFQLCPLSGHYLCLLSFCLPKTPAEALWKYQAKCGKPETRAKAPKKPNLENSDRIRADVGLSLEAKSALTGWVRKQKNLPKSSQKGGTSDILHDMTCKESVVCTLQCKHTYILKSDNRWERKA